MANNDPPSKAPGPGLPEHAISALNAWIGDYLADTDNGLHQPMAFVRENRSVPPAALPVAPKVCVLVHGLGCNESLWSFPAPHEAGDYGSLLERDYGYLPLYVRYNSGQRVSQNGAQLQALLQSYVEHHGQALQELLLIGHSMGGLVIRSACHLDTAAAWTSRVRHIFYLGSPHLGAPLERTANAATHLLGLFDTTATRVIRDLVNSRSAGVKDLRYGNLVDQDWLDCDPDALLENRRVPIPWLETARHHRIVGHLVPGLAPLGDAVVPSRSAEGVAEGAQPGAPQAADVEVIEGLHHLAVAQNPAVYQAIAGRLASDG